MIHEPTVIAMAIDRLNSWARSDSSRRYLSSPVRAIYDWKRHFIEESLRAGRVENPHAIRLTLTCRDCNGSKKYTNMYGEEFPWCRRCGSSGVVPLRFLVTTICGYTWHTPETEAMRISRVCLPEDIWQRSTLSVDWEPNQKGRDLQVHQVAQWLNVLETEYPNVPGSHGVYDYGNWIGDADHKRYKLYLGRFDTECAFCGCPKEPEIIGGCYGVSREFIEWSAWACKPCDGIQGDGKSIFAQFPVPVEQLQHPEIAKWLANRARRKAA